MVQPGNILVRYTNLAALIHMLRTRTVTLVDPAKWDDRNDAYFLTQYKKYRRAAAVLALCFFQEQPGYLHWRVYGHGTDGVGIVFNRDRLLTAFDDVSGIQHGDVQYGTIRGTRKVSPDVDTLPFLRRQAYRHEREYRVIYVDMEEAVGRRECGIALNCIQQVQLSPWTPRELVDSISQTLKTFKGCSGLKIVRSTVTDNESWKAIADGARDLGEVFLEGVVGHALDAIREAMLLLALALEKHPRLATDARHQLAGPDAVSQDYPEIWNEHALGRRTATLRGSVMEFAAAVENGDRARIEPIGARVSRLRPTRGDGTLERRVRHLEGALQRLGQAAVDDDREMAGHVLQVLLERSSFTGSTL